MRKSQKPRVKGVDAIVGRRIREARLALGWNQTKLGKIVGVSFQQFQKYENGHNRISASRLFLIAEALGVSIDALFGDVALKAAKTPKMVIPKGDIPWTRETMQLFKYVLRMPTASRRAVLDMTRRIGA